MQNKNALQRSFFAVRIEATKIAVSSLVSHVIGATTTSDVRRPSTSSSNQYRVSSSSCKATSSLLRNSAYHRLRRFLVIRFASTFPSHFCLLHFAFCIYYFFR